MCTLLYLIFDCPLLGAESALASVLNLVLAMAQFSFLNCNNEKQRQLLERALTYRIRVVCTE